ncbi:MAG: hypothetical protein H6Q00_3200 [Holophagaceae bacterium]|nr:hypothetical protein [Holophagaceae bacterium]
MAWKHLALSAILVAPVLSAQAPGWIQSPLTVFPGHTYLTGYGLSEAKGSEAQRLREARTMARQELAATLRVRVQSEYTSATAHTRKEGTQFVQNLVQTRSDLELEGLDRLETYIDPSTGTVHALAVLEKGRAAALLGERLRSQGQEARSEFQRAKLHKDLEGLLRVRGLLKRIREGEGLMRVNLRVMIDRIVYGQSRFSSTFGAYLEQRLGERLLKFDGIQILDRALASRAGAPLQAQAMLHGTYLEMGDEVSLLLKATALGGEELASSQVRLPKAWIQKAGLRLLPENHLEAAQSLAILDTQVEPSDLKINLQLDRGDGGIYRQDERLYLFLRTSRDCYVRVIYQQVDGTRVQVFPNQYHPDYRVKKEVLTRIPAEGDRFDLRVSEPFGSEIVKVFASTEPFELAPTAIAQEGPFARLDSSLQAMTSHFRGIKFTGR